MAIRNINESESIDDWIMNNDNVTNVEYSMITLTWYIQWIE